MTHYQQLSTTKYYYQSVKDEVKQIRRQKNRDAVRSFFQFLFFLAVAFGTWYAIHQMPNWLPVVQSFMDEKGITSYLQNWFA